MSMLPWVQGQVILGSHGTSHSTNNDSVQWTEQGFNNSVLQKVPTEKRDSSCNASSRPIGVLFLPVQEIVSSGCAGPAGWEGVEEGQCNLQTITTSSNRTNAPTMDGG